MKKTTSKAFIWLFIAFLGYSTFYYFIESFKKNLDIEIVFPIFFLGIIIGAFLFLIFQSVHKSYILNIEKIRIENHFKTIVQDFNSIDFSKRVGDLVFFSYKEYKLLFDIKKNQFFLFLNEDCILTSDTISDTTTIIELRELIWFKFTTQINDCVTLNNIIYSKNLVNEESINNYFNLGLEKIREFFSKKQEDIIEIKELDIDEILDKINKFGIKSLTTDEINFLKNQSQ